VARLSVCSDRSSQQLPINALPASVASAAEFSSGSRRWVRTSETVHLERPRPLSSTFGSSSLLPIEAGRASAGNPTGLAMSCELQLVALLWFQPLQLHSWTACSAKQLCRSSLRSSSDLEAEAELQAQSSTKESTIGALSTAFIDPSGSREESSRRQRGWRSCTQAVGPP
jgi:hypothetical protein